MFPARAAWALCEITSPNGVTLTTSSPTFSMATSTCGETAYEIVIYNNNGVNAVSPIAVTCLGASCIVTPSISLPNGNYTWNVRRVNRGGYLESSNVPFTIAAPQTWYQDNDSDGYGNPNVSVTQVAEPLNYVLDNSDCDDTESTVHPGASEVCGDGTDQDCNGSDLVCTADNDGDGWTNTAGDCDDTDADIHPNAIDMCEDGVDQDCEAGDRVCDLPVCLNIDNTPLESQVPAAPPNIMILLDNSGSMDWTVLTTETNGAFLGFYELYNISDNSWTTHHLSNWAKDHWKSRWHGYNRIYYNPSVTYTPWPATQTYSDLEAFTDPDDAEPSTVRSHPVVGSATVDINDSYYSYTNTHGDSFDLPYAHYFVQHDNTMYLVTMTGGQLRYYEFDDSAQTLLFNVDLTEVTGSDIPPVTSRTYLQERQNFANWFSFYRRRSFTAVSGLSRLIQQMSGVNMGIFTTTRSKDVNRAIIQRVVPIRVDGADDSEILLNRLYQLKVHTYNTYLRRGLKRMGRYFDDTDGSKVSGLGESPYASLENGGACQQAIVIMVADGHWNGDANPNVGDQDEDGWENTLADVAMYYYERDLSDLPDQLIPKSNNPRQSQHLVTYGVAFGIKGNIDPDLYPDCPGDCTTLIPNCDACPSSWPQPTLSTGSRIDDFYHATVNGRGKLYGASDPEELALALGRLLQDINDGGVSGSSLGVNSTQLSTSTVVYQPIYYVESWTGDVKAFPINETTGRVSQVASWSAAEKLNESMDVPDWWSSGVGRKIFTNNGNTGIEFNTANSSTIGLSTRMIEYIRGDDSREGSGATNYRERESTLGDIVYAAPVVKNGLVFVGANDGMLHAFDAATGVERFAYVPSFVVSNLPDLALRDYEHRYYVNATPYVADIDDDTTYLVGGLGKGGRGVYCLDISTAHVNPTSETQAKAMFNWIYPTVEDNDMGYTFSVPYIVDSNAGKVVIFGNGYDSKKGQACLYVLRASDGTLLKKIETQVGNTSDQCNGLSTPALIDSDLDGNVDYAYAGDLQGNMWKFDLTDSDPDEWKVYFEDSSNTPKPLFQALSEDGEVQPITHKPDVVPQCDIRRKGVMVIFGTGRLVGLDDFTNTDVQTIYGIWDWSEDWAANGDTAQERETKDKYLGTFEETANGKRLLSNLKNKVGFTTKARAVTLLEQTNISTSNTDIRVLTDNPIAWYDSDEPSGISQYHVGWYFDLPKDGERVIRDLRVRDNRAVVVTSIPSSSVCESGGISFLMEMNACTGGRTLSPALDYNGDNLIDEDDKVSIRISTPGGGTADINVAPTGIKFVGLINAPVILTMEEGVLERKFFSNSSGTITTIDEKAERTGIYSWRELN